MCKLIYIIQISHCWFYNILPHLYTVKLYHLCEENVVDKMLQLAL